MTDFCHFGICTNLGNPVYIHLIAYSRYFRILCASIVFMFIFLTIFRSSKIRIKENRAKERHLSFKMAGTVPGGVLYVLFNLILKITLPLFPKGGSSDSER